MPKSKIKIMRQYLCCASGIAQFLEKKIFLKYDCSTRRLWSWTKSGKATDVSLGWGRWWVVRAKDWQHHNQLSLPTITTNHHNQPSLPTTTNHYQSLQTKVNIIIIFAIIPLLLSQWQREQMSTLEKANIELCPKYSTFASQYNFREVQLYPFQLHLLVLNNLSIQEVYICF